MEFASQSEAKRFFIDRAVAEASAQGEPLPEPQRYMLAWSESDPQFVQDAAMDQTFEDSVDVVQFEHRISSLLRAAYDRDVETSPGARNRWREAYDVLRRGDHYILVMLKAGLGWRLKRWLLF